MPGKTVISLDVIPSMPCDIRKSETYFSISFQRFSIS